METAEIRLILAKYWQAETTVAEEEQLAAWFQRQDIPADLEPVRELFLWRAAESQVRPGDDFGRRILKRIAATEPRRTVIPFRMAAAAAVIVCLAAGLLIAVIAPREPAPDVVAVRQSATPPGSTPQTPSIREATAAPRVKDTYTDPRQALAAVRNALLLASVRMDKGEQITQKNITRLHKSWEVAIGD